MSTDVARFLRLKGSVQAALDAFPIGHITLAGQALAESYNLLREEVKMSLPDSLQNEFDRMFPELDHPPSSRMNPIGGAEAANAARAKLALLAGWLDGVIEREQ